MKKSVKNLLNYKKPTVWLTIVSAIALVCIGLFFSLGNNPFVNYKEKEMPVTLKNFVIADNKVTLQDKTTANLKLIMTQGTCYDEGYAGAGGGTYKENYEGDYELQLINKEGKLISTISLNEDWDYPDINFGGEFDVLFTDYNNDECPDFSIGTYGSSSMNLYYLYTITKENQIKRICQTPIAEVSNEPSVSFEYERDDGEKLFITYNYNNASGEGTHIIYEWNENTGYFIQKTEQEISEEANTKDLNTKEENTDDELVSLFGKSHDYYFQSDYMGADYDNDGLADTAALQFAEDGKNRVIKISFGNGDEFIASGIQSVAGDYKIAGYDLDEDGENEIVVIYNLGANGGDGMYGLAVYKKAGNTYQSIKLPEGFDEEMGFRYELNWDGKKGVVSREGFGKIGNIDNEILKNHYLRLGSTEEWENLQGKTAHTLTDGVSDFVIVNESNTPVIVLKQYLTGPTEVHVDCIGYVITKLALNKDNTWNIVSAEYLPSD